MTFTAAKVNVTNTASASGSALLDLQIGSASKATFKNVPGTGNFAGDVRLDFGGNIALSYSSAYGSLVVTNAAATSAAGLHAGLITGLSGVFSPSYLSAGSQSELSGGSYRTPTGLRLADGSMVQWSSTAAFGGTIDIALHRNAAGVVEINSGTAGTYRDLYARSILGKSSTGGIGYGSGSGGAVTQATSRTTGVTLNNPTGAITLVSAAGSTTEATFTVTNSTVAATDTVNICQKSGTDKYIVMVSAVAAGSFDITFRTFSGTTTEQPVFNFAVIKAVAA